MLEHTDVSRRIEMIDVLRGLAALMVTWWHVFDHDVRYLADDRLQWFGLVTATHGNLGVYIFFAISGFVIPVSAVGSGRSIVYGRALLKRMVRLYPPFAVSLAFAVAVLLTAPLVPGFAGRPVAIPAGAVALNAVYLAPFFGVAWINPVFWTLLVEVQYYLLIYALLRHIDRVPPPMLATGAAVVALVPLALHSFALILDFTDCFAAGFIAFLVFDRRVSSRAGVLAAIVPLAVVIADKGIVAAVLVALTALLCARRGTAPRLLVWLGTISYSLYLTHYFVGTKAFRLALRFVPAGDGGVILAYALAIAACLLGAVIFYHLAERPAIRWSNRISARPSSAAIDRDKVIADHARNVS